ncbi:MULTISPECIES: vWA domain-containing protein [unclassified Streptomyces]|uniref:vWA domain-containing protein n=1 Tax=unclassified Streptomyces TaxID=2593676 RepID=UPI002DD7C9D4|nr:MULTISPECIES: vWA domain-containing protein [unclassified Streptomyces]WSC35242.1 VWA domain-containing protein [Streptomyces sp. NBC_01763]WSC57484.1 VWA domain-containing protein [Streptomyces sp. NBC_01761]WSF88588.1 VWA domain-containing protein [Streptomyces sp. NBC_01744]
MSEDIKIAADRHEAHIGEEFVVSIAPPVLRRTERVADGVAYVLAVDDSWSMGIRADSTTDEFADAADPNDISRKDVAESGVRELAAALPQGARVDVITFAQDSGLRFSGTAGELRRKGAWDGNPENERGWTNIEGVLQRAYAQLGEQRAGSRRVVLLSDGLPNFGETDPRRLAALAQDAAGRELHTDVIGIGAGADYDLLVQLAPTGMAEHVASRTTAADAMKQITARLAAYGRDVVAGSGELSLEINPHFQVLGVYQIDPTRRRLDGVLADGGGRRPSEVRLNLGAIAEGHDGQPRYALKLRAPERVSAGPLPVLKATGRIGSGPDARQLTPEKFELRTVNNPLAQNIRPDYAREIAAADLERDINDRAAAASDGERERIFEDGVWRARDIPDPDLAASFQQSIGGLREGLQAKDVLNESRATSSRSSTRNKRDWFQDIPVEMPDEIRARRRQRSLDDDDDDDSGSYGGSSYGGGSYRDGAYRDGAYGDPYGGDSYGGGSGSSYGGGADAPTRPPAPGPGPA